MIFIKFKIKSSVLTGLGDILPLLTLKRGRWSFVFGPATNDKRPMTSVHGSKCLLVS